MRNGLHSKPHGLPEIYGQLSNWEMESHAHEAEKFELDIKTVADTFELPSLYTGETSLGKTIHIKNLRSNRYRLKEEIPIYLAEENDSAAAIWYDIGQYGTGPSEEDAIQDLCETIVDYFELLTNEQNLSEQLQSHHQFLLSIIETR